MKILFDFLHEVISTKKLVKKNNLLAPFESDNEEELILAVQEISHVAHTYATVQIECHLGLDINKERQLFHDLNHLGKKIEQSLVLKYDQANPINTFVSNYLIKDNNILNCNVTESVIKFEDCDGSITRRELIIINAKLMFNKATAHGVVQATVDEREELAVEFWQAISNSKFFGEDKARHKTLIAQPVMIRTLASIMHKFMFSNNKDEFKKNQLIDFIENYDFTPSNKVWVCTLLTERERLDNGVNKIYESLADKHKLNPAKCYEHDGKDGRVQIKNITASIPYLTALIEAIMSENL